MKIRDFNVGDVFAMVDILSSIAGSVGNDLTSMPKTYKGEKALSEADAERRGVEIFLIILHKGYLGCKDKVIAWLASLLEISVEEFIKKPPETVLDIIDEIGKREENKSFFSRAYQLYSKIGNL